MEGRKTTTLGRVYSWGIVVLSLVCFFVVIVENDYRESLLLPVSPLLYLTLFVVSDTVFRKVGNSVTSIIAYFGFFIRMVISPFTIVLTNYDVEIPNSIWLQHINGAVMLVSFEYIAFVLYMWSSKKVSSVAIDRAREQPIVSAQTISVLTKVIIMCSVGFVCFCLVRYPSYALSFNSLRDFIGNSEADIILRNNMYNQMREAASSLYTLFNTAFVFVQVIVPAMILNSIYQNRDNIASEGRRKRGVFLSLLVIILSLSILTDDHSKSIVLAFAIIITLVNVYPEEMKKWLLIFSIGGFIGAGFLLLVKTGVFIGRYNGYSSIARILNTYFAGLPNVAVGVAVEYPDKLLTLAGDFLRSIPLVAHFFVDLPRTQELFNTVYHGVPGYSNEIMPTICYGWKYLGPLAPMLTVLVYDVCFRLEGKFLRSEKVFNKAIYAFLLIYFAICPFMYMFTSFLTMWWYSLIFMIIIRSNAEKGGGY